MARLFSNTKDTGEGKYLVQRRDGSVPAWPFFVIAATDPAAPAALRAYASAAQHEGMDPEYVQDVLDLAENFEQYRTENGPGDPDAPRHRTDDPRIVDLMRQGRGA